VLAYLRDQEGAASVSDLARHFNVKGKDRTALRLLLKELEEEGQIEAPVRRKYASRTRLGAVAVLEITGPDSDGELRARPVRWAEDTPLPEIFVAPERGRPAALGVGERILARMRRNPDGSFDARLMRRLGAAPLEIIGVFEPAAGQGRIIPTDRRAKYDYVVRPGETLGAQPGDLVRARVAGSRTRGQREAEVVERIGEMGSPGAVAVIALHSNDIPIAFPDAALAEADAAQPAALDDREDLRAVPLVTIDGEDARDFDDAVFAEPDPDPANPGGWRLVVAIADVGWYVRPGSALDASAQKRGNSVYLPDRVVPMLPEALSNGLCSLRPGEDRAVLAAEMRIDRAGGLKGHRFLRGLMRSAARLTYRQVQDIKDTGGDGLPDGLSPETIGHLYSAYQALDTARRTRGTLDLDLPEFQVRIGEGGHVDAITRRDRLTSHRLIEEFMITANVAAAETLESRRMPCMYRVHEPPDPDKLTELRDFLSTFGLTLPAGNINRAKDFAQILTRSASSPSADIIHEAILRCQSQAAYSPGNRGHFGLALRRYAHFTSPIRRYSDLLVHRGLISGLGLGAGGFDAAALEKETGMVAFAETATHISDTERRAQRAERETVDRYLALYLHERTGQRFPGRITGVTRFGLFVRLAEFGADGLAPASQLGEERWMHDPKRHCLEGMGSGTVYTLGDSVVVAVREANPVTGGLILEVVSHELAKGRKPAKTRETRRGRPPRRRGKPRAKRKRSR
jgi:ribonuclease R